MTKLLCVMLAMGVLLGLCACANNASPNEPATQNTELNGEQDSLPGYGFVFQGVELVPGEPFAAEEFPEPQYSYTQTNSVLGGYDTFYNYVDVEITVHDDGKAAVIRRVIVISPDLKTPEGLSLGDSLEKVTKLYGDNNTKDADVWLFSKGRTALAVLTQDGFVAGIEYCFTNS